MVLGLGDVSLKNICLWNNTLSMEVFLSNAHVNGVAKSSFLIRISQSLDQVYNNSLLGGIEGVGD